jgi:hypothetical protein
MSEIWSGVISIATAIVGLAILATLVSNNANTANVITSAGNAFGNDLKAAESPVTGGSGLSTSILGNSSLSGGASSIFNM